MLCYISIDFTISIDIMHVQLPHANVTYPNADIGSHLPLSLGQNSQMKSTSCKHDTNMTMQSTGNPELLCKFMDRHV